MSILFALALAATPAASPPSAAVVDHSQHAQHQQHAQHLKEMQKHHDQCKDMMAKMHQAMGHGSPTQSGDKAAAEHKGHGGH